MHSCCQIARIVGRPFARRALHASGVHLHGGPHVDTNTASKVTMKWTKAGEVVAETEAYVGQTLLQIAHKNDIELEGACEGVCACSTCHCIMPEDVYDSLPEPSEDEEDMLDMAFGLTETSRLGCQVTIEENMDGMVVQLPSATRNFYVDGHVPQPH